MCGIAGFFGQQRIDSYQISKALELLKRRGPDANGVYCKELGKWNLGLLHTRLSIIDLDERANQPFSFEHITVVFNGEIYNYKEVRKGLEKMGYRFQTTSDTEVLVKGWHAKGEKLLDELEGMWSMAIFNEKEGSVLLCRDRFGEKPFYIMQNEGNLFFGSEIKVLPVLTGKPLEKNLNQAFRYLVNTHKSLNKYGETFYKGVEEVAPGMFWKITPEKITKQRYWTPTYQPVKQSSEEAIERIKEGLINTVKLRMRADVPLAFCLSGGVDSSSLVSIATKELNCDVQTFSIIDRDERYNERENIEATIRDTGCKSEFIELSPDFDYLAHLENLIGYHDGPIGTISYLVHSRLIEAMAQQGYKISISGTGADELFTGYYDHFLYHLAGLSAEEFEMQKNFWEKYPAKTVRNPLLKDPRRFIKDPTNRDHIFLNNDQFANLLTQDFKEEFREQNYTDDLLRNRMMNELFHEVVPVILHEDDLNSMYYSIENRSPFLDRNLFEVAYSISSNLLINKGYNKYLLRQATKGILNDKVRLTREKRGFNASINSLIDLKDANQIGALLDDSPIFDLIEKGALERLLKKEHFPNSYKKFLFNFLNLKIWLSI